MYSKIEKVGFNIKANWTNLCTQLTVVEPEWISLVTLKSKYLPLVLLELCLQTILILFTRVNDLIKMISNIYYFDTILRFEQKVAYIR